jgi:uncharacterized protein YndB with AHSA1/START domain
MENIERSVDIKATPTAVWAIISEPGWWVNKGEELRPHRIEPTDHGTVRVHDEETGTFEIEVVEQDEPRYAAYRWHPTSPDDPATLTEFWLEPHDGGVTLRVVESDFADLPADKLADFLRDNSHGWEQELGLAKARAES